MERFTGCCLQVRRLQNAWRGLRAIREAQRELLLLQLQRFEAQRTGRQSRFAEDPAEAAAAAAGSAGAQVSSTQWGSSPICVQVLHLRQQLLAACTAHQVCQLPRWQ